MAILLQVLAKVGKSTRHRNLEHKPAAVTQPWHNWLGRHPYGLALNYGRAHCSMHSLGAESSIFWRGRSLHANSQADRVLIHLDQALPLPPGNYAPRPQSSCGKQQLCNHSGFLWLLCSMAVSKESWKDFRIPITVPEELSESWLHDVIDEVHASACLHLPLQNLQTLMIRHPVRIHRSIVKYKWP